MPSWDPTVYAKYADHRGRPFAELVARVPATAPGFVVDLGCGDGTLTVTLQHRWPRATVIGVENSADMLTAAAQHRDESLLSFEAGDIATWRSEQPVDVLVSNAALQWVPHNIDLVPRLVESVAPGGYLAVQVPGNFSAPSHALLADLCGSHEWRHLLRSVSERPRSAEPVDYLRALAAAGCTADVWETTYLQVLDGDNPVLDWTRGTALRPVLDTLTEADQQTFLAAYGAALRTAYPSEDFGTVFPFRRIFAVARKHSWHPYPTRRRTR